MKSFLLVSITILIAACGSVKSVVSDKEHAEQLLNERDFDRAISFLESRVKTNPADSEYKVMLASAYTGSVGLNIVDAFAAFQPLLAKQADEKSAKLTTLEGTVATDSVVKDLESKTLKLLDNLSGHFSVITAVPYTPQAERKRLVQAILTLGEIPEADRRFARARNYSAILNALQFLNYLRDSVHDFRTTDSWTPLHFICEFQIGDFLTNVEKTSGYLVSSVEDLKLAYVAMDKEIPGPMIELQEMALHVKDYYNTHKAELDTSEVAFALPASSMCAR